MVLDPIIVGLHFTQVLMDGGSDLNLLYQDTIRKMGINPAIISHGTLPFKGSRQAQIPIVWVPSC